jgi:hypothetical protein
MSDTTVSGFTFVRDAVRLDYPLKESILSALPILDEFVVNLGDCTDDTEALIDSIGSPKVRILHTKWDPARFVHGATNADQTNIALESCRNPWCLYLQADELISEKDYDRILLAMERASARDDVDGLLFSYYHFWGDYGRVQTAHNWYGSEIRAIRNGRGIRSIRSAQSFRRNGAKLRVMGCGAHIYHYGWVRPPDVMRRKTIALDSLHHPKEWVEGRHPEPSRPWDYGPLDKVSLFRGEHPAVMAERIASKGWKAEDYRDRSNPPDHRHLRPSMRALSALERLVGFRIGGYSNWKLVK